MLYVLYIHCVIVFNIRLRHGFAFHMEVAFMETVTKSILGNAVSDNMQTNIASKQTRNGNNSNNKERVMKKCELLLARIKEIPTSVSHASSCLFLLLAWLHIMNSSHICALPSTLACSSFRIAFFFISNSLSTTPDRCHLLLRATLLLIRIPQKLILWLCCRKQL